MGYIQVFFQSMIEANIRYCHWKSNCALERSLAGDADLDLLVSTEDEEGFEQLCKETGFKQVFSPKKKRYPGMKDYLGFDEKSGTLYHLHVHYQLILGEQGAKNYWLPIEKFLLSNTTELHGILIPKLEIEFLLLTLRMALKIRHIDILRGFVRGNNRIIPRDIYDEFITLQSRVDSRRFKEVISNSGIGIPESFFAEAIAAYEDQNLPTLVRLRSKAKRHMRRYRRSNIITCNLRVLRNFVADRLYRFVKPAKKSLPDGKIIAVVGADGAGKSSTVDEIHRWLSAYLNVYNPYFGIPKMRWVKGYCFLLAIVSKAERVSAGMSGLLSKLIGVGGSLIEASMWINVARARKRLYRRSVKMVDKGYVVVADRYPIEAFDDLSDEPMDRPMIQKLTRNRESKLIELLSKVEKRLYQSIGTPDYIVALDVSLETAHIRAKEERLDLESHADKIKMVANLRACNGAIKIDADEPFESVLLNVKCAVWNMI